MTTLIGYRWKRSDVWSRVVLITRKLPTNFSQLEIEVCYSAAPRARLAIGLCFSLTCSKRKGVLESSKEQLVVIARRFTSSHSEQRS